MNKRRMLILSSAIMVLTLLAPFSVAACGRAAQEGPAAVKGPENAPKQKSAWEELVDGAKKEGNVMIYATELGAAQQILTRALKDKFDIDLNTVGGRGPEVVAKLTAERRAGLNLGDVGLTGPSTFIDEIKPLGITVPLPPLLTLPEVTDPSKWRNGKIPYLDNERHSLVMVAIAAQPSIRNTEMVKEGEVSSFLDYLEPKWKGKIVLSDPSVAGNANYFFAHMATQLFGQERTVQILRQLAAQDPVVIRDQRQLLEWVARGKYPIGIGHSSTQFAEYKRLGAPVELVKLKEPPFLSSGSGNVYVFDKAPHPNALKLFVNWLLSKEGATIWSQATGNPSMRLDVTVEGLDSMTLPPPGGEMPNESQLKAQAEMRKIADGIFSPLRK